MKRDEYEKAQSTLHQEASRIALNRRPDYTIDNEDVVHNFKAAAEFAGVSPLQAWLVYAYKHWAAIAAHARRPEKATSEPILGRYADMLNYLDLGWALVREDEDERKTDDEFFKLIDSEGKLAGVDEPMEYPPVEWLKGPKQPLKGPGLSLPQTALRPATHQDPTG